MEGDGGRPGKDRKLMLYLIASLLFATAPPEQSLHVGGELVGYVIAGQALLTSTEVPQRHQTLTTTVQDPSHPDEPWTINTYRADGESQQAWVRRHAEGVAAVREALGTS